MLQLWKAAWRARLSSTLTNLSSEPLEIKPWERSNEMDIEANANIAIGTDIAIFKGADAYLLQDIETRLFSVTVSLQNPTTRFSFVVTIYESMMLLHGSGKKSLYGRRGLQLLLLLVSQELVRVCTLQSHYHPYDILQENRLGSYMPLFADLPRACPPRGTEMGIITAFLNLVFGEIEILSSVNRRGTLNGALSTLRTLQAGFLRKYTANPAFFQSTFLLQTKDVGTTFTK
jgi:hypothetical protein